MQVGDHALNIADREQLSDLRFLNQRGNKIREQNVHAIHFTFYEHVPRELRNRARFAKERRIFVSEFGGELPFCPGDELRALAAGSDKNRGGLIELYRLPHQVAVKPAAQTLIRANNDNATFAAFPFFSNW